MDAHEAAPAERAAGSDGWSSRTLSTRRCGFLRELASNCSPATLRSYAFDLPRWLRFLEDRAVEWRRAERVDVRELVEVMRESPNPQRLFLAAYARLQ
jgi:site-specific recombinase XerD